MTQPWVHSRLVKGKQQQQVVELITVQEVMKRLKCSKSNVYKMCDSGELQSIKLGESKGLRILKKSFDAYLARKLEEWQDGEGLGEGATA